MAVATDPVCGMEVAVTVDALRFEYAGGTWYFCGSGCRGAFADAPGRYV
jgi:xanthine dehydrogenase accessory factor